MPTTTYEDGQTVQVLVANTDPNGPSGGTWTDARVARAYTGGRNVCITFEPDVGLPPLHVKWVDRDFVRAVFIPDMGWLSCRYVFEGSDPEGGDYYRCLTHSTPERDVLTLGHQVSCEYAGDNEEG